MASYGNYLMIRTCHEMYETSDGSHHQANVTIQIDTSAMKVVDSFSDVMNTSYGYVSHSFNQFIQMENGKIVAVDHGDAYPRSAVLIKYPSAVTSAGFTKAGCQAVDVVPFTGETGANYTGASIGGFEISDTAYLVAGSMDIDSSARYTAGRNIFIGVVSKDTGDVSVNTITDYTSGNGTTDTPQFVKNRRGQLYAALAQRRYGLLYKDRWRWKTGWNRLQSERRLIRLCSDSCRK